MPYARGTTILGEEVSYDSGDYPAALAEAVALSGFPASAAFPSHPADGTRAGAEPTPRDAIGTDAGPAGAAERHRRGMGLACFVEKTGTGPFEGARAFLDRSGALVVATGACDLGQGIETCLAQIAGDALGVDHAGSPCGTATPTSSPTGSGASRAAGR